MGGNLPGLKRRLAKVEKGLAATAEREKLAGCNCKLKNETATIVLSSKPEEFEAEMNQTCPRHGFRDLGELVIFKVVGQRGVPSDTSRIDALLAKYRARKSEYERAKLEHASQEA